jgi:hypothetical protein
VILPIIDNKDKNKNEINIIKNIFKFFLKFNATIKSVKSSIPLKFDKKSDDVRPVIAILK